MPQTRRLVAATALAAALAATPMSMTVSAAATGPAGHSPASPRSGTVVDSSGRVIGGWLELGAPGPSTHGTSSTTSLTSGPQSSSGRQDVGGGVWTYGSYDENGYKHCWSKYYNIYDYHSATAAMSTTKKVYAWQFEYADAHIAESIGIGVTCKVYWGVYP
ncbi:lactococcin 972 family bacteriocin [Terrabacter sp. LjRoot27]|uniref:lactococcin 972 family bacteriocin n=1 Tax=Terrabacter sp. LjRoot27 TaxID=3342306 RepID=UPI003ECFF284